MKKGLKKFTKILVLIAMIFSDLMTPIKVFANEISDRDPVKGDIGINNKVTNDGNSITVSSGSLDDEGDVLVTKTVSKTNTEGKYEVRFTQTNEVLSKEYDYDRVCEEFENWKRYYF